MSRADRLPHTAWRRFAALALVGAFFVAVELLAATPLAIPNPGPAYIMLVVLGATLGGGASALLGAALSVLAMSVHLSAPGRLLHYSDFDSRRLIVYALVAPTAAVMVILLKRRWDAYHRRAREADVQQAGLAVSLSAQERMRETLSERDAVLRTVSVGVAFARDRRHVWVNPAMSEVSGFSEEELVGMPTEALYAHREDWERVGREGYAALSNGLPYESEHLIRRKDGALRWVRTNGRALDVADLAKGSIWVIEDITGRKRSEGALRDSEERHRAFFQVASVGLGTVDPATGRWVEVNEKMCQIAGYGAEELTGGLTTLDITHPDDRDRDAQRYQKLVRGEIPAYEGEKRYVRKDGSIAWVHVNVTLIRDREGRPWRTAGIVLDITERLQLALALRESESNFELIARSVNEMFWIFDVGTGCLRYVSPAFAQIWARQAEDAAAAGTLIRQSIHPEDRAAFEAQVRRVEQGLETQGEYRIVRPDGAVRWIRCRAFPMRDEAGRPVRVAGVAEDITERKLGEERRLADALRQRDALVREVHHRIKNNLQGVVGLLTQDLHENPELAPLLRRAAAQVQVVAIVHGLQGKSVAGGVRICGLVTAIASNVESLVQESIAVSVDVPPGGLRVAESESVAVALIANELMFNAVKHSAHRAGVTAEVRREGDAAVVRIASPGRLPPEFDLVAGTGVGTGLELVRALMPASGGSLSIAQQGENVVAELRLRAPVIDS